MTAGAVPFLKYEGLGNDFVVVDLRAVGATAGAEALATPDAARDVCDRRFGIGADGVLPILPATTGDADVRMRVLNADGSEAEMCGNGIRCVAKHLFDTDPALRRENIRIETLAGVLTCRIERGADGRAASVTVDMGRPRLAPDEIPVALPGAGPITRHPLVLGGRPLAFTAVSMGNPHAVVFLADHEGPLDVARSLGPELEGHSLFPKRTNAEFAVVRAGGSDIDLVVYERGCGITLACGTGACATAVAAVLEQRAAPDRELAVHLPGGTLHILVRADLGGVRMRGPASLVYSGSLDLGALIGRRTAARVAAL